MIRTAIIRESRIRNAKGQDCYEAVWADDGVTPCTVRVAAPRGYYPYAVDDVVMVALPGGDHTAGRIIGLYESAQVEPQAEGNTERHPRDGGNHVIGAGDGEIHLGVGASDAVAREGDSVDVTIPALSFLVAATAGVLNPNPVTVSGTITSGSAVVKAVA